MRMVTANTQGDDRGRKGSALARRLTWKVPLALFLAGFILKVLLSIIVDDSVGRWVGGTLGFLAVTAAGLLAWQANRRPTKWPGVIPSSVWALDEAQFARKVGLHVTPRSIFDTARDCGEIANNVLYQRVRRAGSNQLGKLLRDVASHPLGALASRSTGH